MTPTNDSGREKFSFWCPKVLRGPPESDKSNLGWGKSNVTPPFICAGIQRSPQMNITRHGHMPGLAFLRGGSQFGMANPSPLPLYVPEFKGHFIKCSHEFFYFRRHPFWSAKNDLGGQNFNFEEQKLNRAGCSHRLLPPKVDFGCPALDLIPSALAR